MRPNPLLSLLLLLGLLSCITSCKAPFKKNSGDATGQLLTEIPFKLDHGHIAIPIRLNNSQPMDFIVDSGAGVPLVNNNLIAPLQLHQTWLLSQRVECWNGWGTVRFLDNISININDIQYSPFLAATMPLPSIHGLLGYDLFTRFVVEIDFEAGILRLYNPKRFVYKGSGSILPIRIHHRVPYIKASVTGPDLHDHKGSFLIDTGNPGLLSINESFVRTRRLIEPSNRRLKAIKGDLVSEFPVRYGQITQLKLGPYTIHKPWCDMLMQSILGSRNDGIIGLKTLKQFKAIFDYKHRRLILEPNANYGRPIPLQWRGDLIQISSTDGFRICLSGAYLHPVPPEYNSLRVTYVKPGSPAELAGIHINDLLTLIDAKPISAFNLGHFMDLIQRNGQTCSIELVRGQATISTVLLLDLLCFWEETQ